MKQVEFPKFKDYKNQVVQYLQPKLDGYLAKISKDEKTVNIFTKNDKNITSKVMAITHIKKALDNLPSFSALFGELHCPGIPATSVVTMLNDADQRLHLTIFAAPIINNADLSDMGLQLVMSMIGKYGFETPETTFCRACGWGCNLCGLTEKRKKELLQIAIENKFEGWVLKEGHMKGWYKMKPVKTIDAFVTNTYKSTSDSFPGGLKCIQVGIWNGLKIHNLGTAGNGFKKPFRMQFMLQEQIDVARTTYVAAHPNASDEELKVFDLPRLQMDILLNKVCEIAYDRATVGGKLRFPRFIRWRDDKNERDCTEDQLK